MTDTTTAALALAEYAEELVEKADLQKCIIIIPPRCRAVRELAAELDAAREALEAVGRALGEERP